MKKTVQNALLMSLVLSLSLPVSACGKKKDDSISGTGTSSEGTCDSSSTDSKASSGRTVKETDPYFSLEETDIKLPVADGQKLVSQTIDHIQMFPESILVEYHNEYDVDPEIMNKWIDYQMGQSKLSDDELQKLTDIVEASSETRLAVLTFDGTCRCCYVPGINNSLIGAFENDDGKVMVIINSYGMEENGQFLAEVSDSGDLKNKKGITVDNLYTKCTALPAGNGNIFIAVDGQIFLLDKDGSQISSESDPEYVGRILTSGGKFYVLGRDASGNDLFREAYYLSEIDPSSGKVSDDRKNVSYQIQPDDLIQGQDRIYLNTGNGLSELDLSGDGQLKETLSWSETDCMYTRIHKSGVRAVSDDEYFFLRNVTADSDSADFKLMHLKREQKNPHAGKDIIVLAGFTTDDDSFVEKLVEYNRDPSKKARIEVRDYSSETDLTDMEMSRKNTADIADKIHLDLLNGDGPDILMNFSQYMQFDQEDVLLDLNTFVDGTDGLDRTKLFDNVLRAFETDGKLYQIPVTFYMMGYVGNQDLIGERDHWTIEEMNSVAESVPGNTQFISPSSWNGLQTLLLGNYISDFIDYDKGEVHFDTKEYRDILDFVRKYGSSKTDGELAAEKLKGLNMSDRDMLDAGMISIMDTTIMGTTYFAYIDSSCRGKLSYAGYPSSGEGGMAATAAISMAIAKASSHPEEAWEFIRFLFEKDVQVASVGSWQGFPVNKEACEVIMQNQQTYYQQMKASLDQKTLDKLMISVFDDKTKEHLLSVIGNIHNCYRTDPSVFMIIQEESPAYFTGSRSADDVIRMIENRAKQIVAERG
ncbi:MAG: extracellular solute-binding protein [Clostridiales bacterium]|nr:extracellular solute-binding protein [Clostridiales bacterium]